MARYYKLKKDSFMWEEGAVITNKEDEEMYRSTDEAFNKVDLKTEFISSHIIENPRNADFFERVYPINLGAKMIYRTKELAKEFLSKEHTE